MRKIAFIILLLVPLSVFATWTPIDKVVTTSIESGVTGIVSGADKSVCFDDGGVFNCADAGLQYTKATTSLRPSIITMPVGAVTAPTITPEGDTDTGIYWVTSMARHFNLAIDGVKYIDVGSVSSAFSNSVSVPNMSVNAGGSITSPQYKTSGVCTDSSGDAACADSAAGSVVIDATDTTTVVNTTAVNAGSQIFIQEDSSLGTLLGVTCNTTTVRAYYVTARTAATSFTITASAAPVTDPACLSYFIVN